MISNLLVLCLSSLLAGAINAVAGGGTLLTFPALVAALGGSDAAKVLATGTSTVALVPGSLGAIWAYRRELSHLKSWIRLLMPVSIVGGGVGALAVVALPPMYFAMLVPWLILMATLLFALQPTITHWTGLGREQKKPARAAQLGVIAFQFLVAVYGGYFGAGIGILMLSALAMLGLTNIHAMNGLKSLLAAGINTVASAVFMAEQEVHWPFALLMATGAILGGLVGGTAAQRVNRDLVRRLVVLIGLLLASYYFYGEWAYRRASAPTMDESAGCKPMGPTPTQQAKALEAFAAERSPLKKLVQENACRNRHVQGINARV